MHHQYWLERWKNNDIGFHNEQPNTSLLQHIALLNLRQGARVFVPLCGKTLDISWLLSQGLKVVAIELSEQAVNALFSQLNLHPDITRQASLNCYEAGHLTVFQGDIFTLNTEILGEVNAVYDRGALVALPADIRCRYARLLCELCSLAPQLLITCWYKTGPKEHSPYPISEDEIHRLYGTQYRPERVSKAAIEEGVKGISPAFSEVWHLIPAT